MKFLKWLTDPLYEKREQAARVLERMAQDHQDEMKRLEGTPEARAVYSEIHRALRAFSEEHNPAECVIEVSGSTFQIILEDAIQKFPFSPELWPTKETLIYGHPIRIVDDEALSGTSVRVVHEPPLKPYTVTLKPDE